MYLGDFAEDGDLFFKFTTRAFATGVPTTLAGTPVLSVYKDEGGAASEKTTAESYFDLDVDHDSIAGWHNVRVDLSGDAFFATGADYSIVITTGTVGGVNVFGENLANFSIENRSMGQPAGTTLAADIAALKAETALIVADTGTDGVVVAAASKTGYALSTAGILAIWHQALTAVVTAGSVGKLLKDEITSVRMATLTDWINGGRLDLLLDAIPTTAMRGTDGANTTTPLSAAQVNAEMVDVLVTDTHAESSGVVAATSSIRDAIMWLKTLSRNKGTQTATTKTLRNDADSGDIATSAVSDDATTFTRNEWV